MVHRASSGQRLAIALGLALLAESLSAQEFPLAGPNQCWLVYMTCNDAAFGIEAWRTTCYSDLTACLPSRIPVRCAPQAQETCRTSYEACIELARDTPIDEDQCVADLDACMFAFGC